MIRRPRNRRWLATLVLPLLAATLACNTLSGGGAAGVALTQAAATVTAVANQAATALAGAPTAAPLATQAPTVASSPTAAGSPIAASTATVAATVAATAAATDTPAAANTGTPAAADTPAAGAVVLDPCTLVTADQAKAILGEAVAAPKPQSGGCIFADAATGHTSGVVIYALPASQSQAFFGQFAPSLKQAGVTVDPKQAAQLDADTTAGDTVAAVNDITAMSINQPKYHAEKVDGLGSAAVWSWNKVLTFQEGLLVAAKPGAVVAMAVITPAALKEADAKTAMQQIVTTVLAGLPANFTVTGLQVAGSAVVLDPCSLATASQVDPIMGTQSEDGVVGNGMCNFQDVATHKLAVRIFALPAGATAENALNLAALTILIGDKTTEDKVMADLTAGDLVAAVHDMGAASHTGKYSLSVVSGLGDTGFGYIATVGSERVLYYFAAKPNWVVGVEGLLGPGDDKATGSAADDVLTRIVTNLPDKFIVNGVP